MDGMLVLLGKFLKKYLVKFNSYMGKMSSEQASQKKELGHAEERTFNAFFGNKNTRGTNFSEASADNYISNKGFQKELLAVFPNLEDFSVSLKSGKTWQFHLGRIDELSPMKHLEIAKTDKNETKAIHKISFDEQKKVLKSTSFWEKYLGKKSELLCYNDKQKKYTFFLMSDVVNFIIKNTTWDLLNTGRLKGKILKNGKKRSILTFEYRNKKGQFAIGAMGGQGKSACGFLLFEILRDNLPFKEIQFNAEIIEQTSFFIPKKEFTIGMKGKVGATFFDDDYLYICLDGAKWKKIKLEKI